ncbi:hypothetical protein [Mycolicibacterium hodleri]|uniref:hypothetical protein n=1 Tax=Mycolicibacterium hodleri TaxID=49897 RepID=UPI00112C73C9|nr:hypothetical protein [Mycolicibacterium hodleri]
MANPATTAGAVKTSLATVRKALVTGETAETIGLLGIAGVETTTGSGGTSEAVAVGVGVGVETVGVETVSVTGTGTASVTGAGTASTAETADSVVGVVGAVLPYTVGVPPKVVFGDAGMLLAHWPGSGIEFNAPVTVCTVPCSEFVTTLRIESAIVAIGP